MNWPSARSSLANPRLSSTKRLPESFRRNLKIHLTKRFTELVVLLWLETEIRLLTNDAKLDIVVLVLAKRNVVRRNIRQFREFVAQRLFKLPAFVLADLEKALEFGDFSNRDLSRFLITGCLRLADFLRCLIALFLRGLQFGNMGAALFVDFDQACAA